MRSALVIAQDIDGGAAEVEVRLVERGFEVETHHVTNDYEQPADAAPFPNVEPYDIIVAMGSVHSVAEPGPIAAWLDAELELLRAAHERDQPILGICFGGQALAAALGGAVERAATSEIGWYEIDAAPGATNPVGPGPWFEWHHDRFEPPPGAEVLAVTDAAVQLYRIGASVGTQFHPEVNVAHITVWLKTAPDEYLAELGIDRETLLAETRERETANTKQCHRLVDWFLDDVAGYG